jgi:hypothetical protein
LTTVLTSFGEHRNPPHLLALHSRAIKGFTSNSSINPNFVILPTQAIGYAQLADLVRDNTTVLSYNNPRQAPPTSKGSRPDDARRIPTAVTILYRSSITSRQPGL